MISEIIGFFRFPLFPPTLLSGEPPLLRDDHDDDVNYHDYDQGNRQNDHLTTMMSILTMMICRFPPSLPTSG